MSTLGDIDRSFVALGGLDCAHRPLWQHYMAQLAIHTSCDSDGLLLSGKCGWCAGHRSIKSDSLPLKRGMLVFAFSRKMPVQVLITAFMSCHARSPCGPKSCEPAAEGMLILHKALQSNSLLPS